MFKTVPTPNYVLTEEFKWGSGVDTFTMEAGTFIRPIDERWVPKHVTNDVRTKVKGKDDTYCMTPRCGIVPIPKRIIRQV